MQNQEANQNQDNDCETLKRQIERLNVRIFSLENLVKDKERIIEKLQSKLGVTNQNYGTLKGQTNSLTDDENRLEREKGELKTETEDKNQIISQLDNEIVSLNTQITNLNNTINQLKEERDWFKTELDNQIKQGRLKNLFAVGVFVTDYLPVPEKWQTAIKGGFTSCQTWVIVANIPKLLMR